MEKNFNALCGIDEFGRTIMPYDSIDEKKKVGIFYFCWLGQLGDKEIYDIEKLLKKDPESLWDVKGPDESPAWGFQMCIRDRYQDVNDLQDMFFYAISRDNLFVVGDVKQSIYAFRRANPMNFIRKKDQFEKIDLNKNFRSRGGVLGFTNFVCKVLFSNEFGGLTYDKNEALVQGSSLYEAEETPDVEMNIVISDTDQVRNQAQVVADKIKQLLREKYRITLKNGGSRCITPSDIAIPVSYTHLDVYKRQVITVLTSLIALTT